MALECQLVHQFSFSLLNCSLGWCTNVGCDGNKKKKRKKIFQPNSLTNPNCTKPNFLVVIELFTAPRGMFWQWNLKIVQIKRQAIRIMERQGWQFSGNNFFSLYFRVPSVSEVDLGLKMFWSFQVEAKLPPTSCSLEDNHGCQRSWKNLIARGEFALAMMLAVKEKRFAVLKEIFLFMSLNWRPKIGRSERENLGERPWKAKRFFVFPFPNDDLRKKMEKN